MSTVYVEPDCVFDLEGRRLESGGAFVSPEYIVAYPGANGALLAWHGERLGSWRAVSSWRVESYMGSRMFQVEARVNGVAYTGRGFGEGCIYRDRRKAGQS